MTKHEIFLKDNRIDKDERVDCDGGGIYLKNLLEKHEKMVRDEVLYELVKKIRKEISWLKEINEKPKL